MLVSEAMTRDVRVASPDHTIQAAAKIMAEIDAGVLPVAENDQLIGMITDRDIALRAVAEGKGPGTRVREVMSPDVKYCFDDEPVWQVVHTMGDVQLRRLPVVNREKRLVGILSLGDLAVAEGGRAAGEALAGVSHRRRALSDRWPALVMPVACLARTQAGEVALSPLSPPRDP